MKRIFLFFAACAMSIGAFAASITAPNVDFGTVSIKGETLPKYGSETITVTWSGLTTEGATMYAEITDGLLDDATNPNGFYVSDPDYVYLGYGGKMVSSCTFEIGYGVKEAGTFTGKLHLYSFDTNWNEVHKYVNITITVTNDAIVAKTTPFERINSISNLKEGDVVVFVCESSGAVNGPLTNTYLPAIWENVTINSSTGKADIPETAQTFTMSKYNGNWQFTATGTTNRLLLDISGKGAFAYGTPSETMLAGWGISISNGTAMVSKPDDTFPVEFNSDRFKPYKNPQGSTYQLYKKSGEPEELKSSLTINPTTITMESVEMEETGSVTINYTAKNLTDDIIWDVTGTNASWFDVSDTGDRENGTVTITYKGNGNKTGAVSASLAYLTQDAQLDPMEGSFPINLTLLANTVKLTKLEFVGAPETIDQGQSIDMSQFIVYTPDNAADKSLTWSVDKSYQGTIDEKGVLKAYQVTGNVTVTATSVRVPSVSASTTLTIQSPTITDFTLSKSEVTLNVGGTETLSVTAFIPAYASATPTYSSNNTTVATVNKNGLITAKAIGDAEISATIGDVVKSCQVHVVAVTVENIAFANAEVNLTLGASLQLNPIITPAQAANEYTVSYESSDTEVAIVDENGKVSAVAVGDAVITATIAGKEAQITIHVIAAKTFAKVTDASVLAEKDTIILALQSAPVIAGARDGKKLTVLTNDITVTDVEAYADNACRMVLGKEKNKEGFTLTIVGGKTIAVTSSGNDIVDANTQNCKFWEFVADGNKGFYVHNLGNTNAYFKYHAGNAAIKPYKSNTTGAEYVYVYVRKYVEPQQPQGIDNTAAGIKVHKIMREGQLYILRDGKTYTTTGIIVQ